jgi:hypothetical protein
LPTHSKTDLRSHGAILPKLDREVLDLGVRSTLVERHVLTNETLRSRLLNVSELRLNGDELTR